MTKLITTAGIFLFTLFAVTAQTEDTQVTDAELQKFSEAYMSVQQMNQTIQQEMVVAIEKEGMTPQRFNEIYQAEMDPEVEVDATAEELEKKEAVMVVIQKIQSASQAKMEDKIKEKGLTFQRFQEIGAQVQQSPELQQKLQGMMMKQQTGSNPMQKN
ncbi:DUF4168 domain-containing protein [Psychroflexus sp. YR1-1]|uniref:DUF4168 domain-containing protein n=1 Tax=Psychroflexus aurantiacus TaxID=2709310 RepID=A0A6B3R4Z3_9FLAO|nr:DUF4168 domain-containing protein [Psychroflexus aurantiacus]NEV94025.1 DUF4168 domain-containing protein [Psychroflexus aurantiacus]